MLCQLAVLPTSVPECCASWQSHTCLHADLPDPINVQLANDGVISCVQDDGIPEVDEESEREAQLLLVEMETMKAVEQSHMLQQVGHIWSPALLL